MASLLDKLTSGGSGGQQIARPPAAVEITSDGVIGAALNVSGTPTYAYQPLPKGNRLAIVTNTGGPGVLCTDAAVTSGELEIAKFEPSTTAALRDSVPATASVKNPVDVLGDGRSDVHRGARHHPRASY